MPDHEGTAPAPAENTPAGPDYGVTLGPEPGPGDPRRRRTRGVVALVVVALAAMVAMTQLTGRPERSATVQAGSAADGPTPVTSPPAPPLVGLEVAPGWQTLLADGEHLVVGTRPLSGRDLLLALLTRDDAVFSDFPADGAVLVVGGDRFVAKYVGPSPGASVVTSGNSVEITESTPDALVGAGPPLGLGPAQTLTGGVTLRLGDVPKSSLTLAAYLGPRAPDSAARDAEAMAATVHLPPSDPTVIPPPPPPGSRPGFDAGGVELADGQGVEAVSTKVAGVTYTVRADADCAVVVAGDSLPPSAGGCQSRPAAGSPAVVVAVAASHGPPPLPPPPGASLDPTGSAGSQSMIVLARVAPDVRRVTAVLTDGRTADAKIGRDGWALVVTDGRAFLLEVRDSKGKVLAQSPVT